MANKKILIVDDAELDRKTLKAILGPSFDISEADNGYSAIKLIPHDGRGLDAIFLDISMPVHDGFHVLQHMQNNNIRNIPVFMVTAEATSDNVERAAQYHIAGFIKKPFEKEDILRRLESRIGKTG